MSIEIKGGYLDSSPVPSLYHKTIFISDELISQLKSDAAASPNKEVCGLITGDSDAKYCHAQKYHKITNIASNNLGYDDYMMDPQESMDVLKDTQIIPIGEHKTDLVAIFHSHPRSLPYPSIIDINNAAYNVIYIIYSVVFDKFTFQYWNGSWFIPINVEVI